MDDYRDLGRAELKYYKDFAIKNGCPLYKIKWAKKPSQLVSVDSIVAEAMTFLGKTNGPR